MIMDLTRLLLQCRLTGGKVIRIPVTASRDHDTASSISGGSRDVPRLVLLAKVGGREWGPAPLHRIVASGEEDGVRWAHFEPISS